MTFPYQPRATRSASERSLLLSTQCTRASARTLFVLHSMSRHSYVVVHARGAQSSQRTLNLPLTTSDSLRARERTRKALGRGSSALSCYCCCIRARESAVAPLPAPRPRPRARTCRILRALGLPTTDQDQGQDQATRQSTRRPGDPHEAASLTLTLTLTLAGLQQTDRSKQADTRAAYARSLVRAHTPAHTDSDDGGWKRANIRSRSRGCGAPARLLARTASARRSLLSSPPPPPSRPRVGGRGWCIARRREPSCAHLLARSQPVKQQRRRARSEPLDRRSAALASCTIVVSNCTRKRVHFLPFLRTATHHADAALIAVATSSSGSVGGAVAGSESPTPTVDTDSSRRTVSDTNAPAIVVVAARSLSIRAGVPPKHTRDQHAHERSAELGSEHSRSPVSSRSNVA